ncbi:unnamed protein product [Arctogadus glacialis]
MRAADMADAMNTGFWEVRIGGHRHSPPRAAPRHGSSDLPLTITPPTPSQLDGVRGFTNPSLPSMRLRTCPPLPLSIIAPAAITVKGPQGRSPPP